MQHGERTRIARKVGVAPGHIAAIVKGNKKASPELAALLEKATGVDRRAWLYPDEFPNPLINGKKHEATNGDAQN